jgi:choice-of-anchor B domain-containing protein
VNNVSGGFACQSIGLLSHLSLQDLRPQSSRGNDVWGYTDLNTGREYAIMGLQNGLAVVDVTNPEAPEQVGETAGSATTWRDIKIYQLYDSAAARWRAYAYATADNVGDFLVILDLSSLPNGVERVSYNSDFRAAHNLYMTNADYTFGLAQTTQAPLVGIAGAGIGGGSHRLYTLENPRSPRLVSVSTGGYAHDMASFPVADARKNTQCVNAQSQAVCQVLSDFNEGTVDLWDITNPSAPQRLATQPYANAAYVHSGWWTEDGRYLLVHDELDEQNLGLNTTVRVFDMNNLRAPTLVGSWVGPTRAIDHNGFVKGNRHYVANYSEGLTVLDISNPRAPVRVGYFDTYPASSGLGFVGAWGAYPFFASGTIAAADINSGLYLLRNETLASANGSFVMNNAAIPGTEGQSFNVSVNRTGGGSGAVTVQVEALYASAGSSDATLASTQLSWGDGDTTGKSATIQLLADNEAENLELVLVRLKNPQGGATLGYPDTTHVYIGDPNVTTRLQWLEAAPAVDDARGKVLIPVTRQGSASGQARVNYRTLSGGTYTGFTPTEGELVWADGDAAAKIITVPLDPAALSNRQSASFQVELFGAVNAALQNAGGTSSANLVATINVTDSSTATPPPTTPPPASSGGGGGSGGSEPLWLALLAALLYVRRLVSRA